MRGIRLILVFLALAFAGLASAQPPYAPPGPGQRTVYRGFTLIDGTGTGPQSNMALITNGERIEAVLPVSELTAERIRRAEIVDLTGRYLLPGLIDSHQHRATPPDRADAERQMRRDVTHGITAARIMADDIRLIAELDRASRAGEIAGPDFYFAALVAGRSFFADPRIGAVSAGYAAGEAPWAQAIDAETDLRLAIARARGTGATAIKIYADLPPALVRRVTEEAHRQGLMVWAHFAVFPTLPSEVLAAGPDSVSHTCYAGYQAMPNPPQSYRERFPIDPAPFAGRGNAQVAALFRTMRERGIVLDATLSVYAEIERRAARGATAHCTLNLAGRLTGQANWAGVLVSAGTDADAPADEPYPALFGELELLVSRAGFTPLEAIRAATQVGAMSIGKGQEMGVIAEGYLANMVVLERNPVADIANMRSVLFTVKRGRRFDRAEARPLSPLGRRAFLAMASAAALPLPAQAQPRRTPLIVNALGGLYDPNAPPGPSNAGVEAAVRTSVGQRLIDDARASGMNAVNMTLGYVAGDRKPFEQTVEEIATWDWKIRQRPDDLLKVLTAADIFRARRENRIGLIYGFQNGAMLGARAERADTFANLGVRIVQLTYNPANQLGDGSMAPGNRGLTPFGRAAVARLNENRMMIDLSHSGERTCLEAARLSSQPISINHTGCRALTDVPRNKSDAELRLVAERGGFVGIYFMPFLSPDSVATAADVVAHLEHALNVCGEDHVGIGTDGGTTAVDDMAAFRARTRAEIAERRRSGIGARGENPDTLPFVEELSGPDQFRRLIALLERRRHPARRIEKIMGVNFVNFAREVWGG